MPNTAFLRRYCQQRRGLRSHLIMLILAALLPLVLFSVCMVLEFAREERRTTERGMRETTRALALAMDREVGEVQAALGILALSHLLAVGDLEGFYWQCLKALRFLPHGAWITLSDLQGQLLLNTRVPYGTPLPRKADIDAVRRVAATGRPRAAPGAGYGQRHSRRTSGTDLRVLVYHEARGDRPGLVHCAGNCDGA